MQLRACCRAFVVVLLCGVGAKAQVRPPITEVPVQYTCENITMIDFCSEVNYSTASFPNYRNQPNQMAASSELENFIALAQTVCSNAVVHFLCSVYAPFCDPRQPQFRVPPCKELCQHVRNGCENLVIEFGLTWPPHLDCALYPTKEEDPITFCPDNITAVQIPPNIATRPPPNVTLPTPPSTTASSIRVCPSSLSVAGTRLGGQLSLIHI